MPTTQLPVCRIRIVDLVADARLSAHAREMRDLLMAFVTDPTGAAWAANDRKARALLAEIDGGR